MKYNNKYAIALVLLASSAFGASSVPAEPDYDALKTAVMAALGADKTFKGINSNSTEMETLKGQLSAEQLAAFGSRKGEKLDETKIQEILENVYRNQVAEAEKQKAEAAEAEKQKAEAAEAEKQKAEILGNAEPDQIPSGEHPSGDDNKHPSPPNPSDEHPSGDDNKHPSPPNPSNENKTPDVEKNANAAKVAEDNKKLAEQKQKEDDEKANKTTDDPIAKIKVALDSVKDFSELSPESIKALGLTDKQVEALKKANVTKATTDEDINKALKGEAETTPNTQNKGAKDINASKDEPTQGDKAEVPFYKNAWIMVPSGVILLSAIGGGVFMMTRKTEDTDL
jgi:thiol:disulfide interchange protein